MISTQLFTGSAALRVTEKAAGLNTQDRRNETEDLKLLVFLSFHLNDGLFWR